MKILDLGCGTAKVKGAVGVDVVRLEGVNLVSNLSSLPFPFADNTFDAVYLNDVIEHLPNTLATMEEIYRISRPGARVYIRVVNWNSHYTAMDPTHLHAFTENSFDFFGKRQGRSYYSKAKFNVIRIGYQYNVLAEEIIKYRPLMKFLSYYLNNILEGLSFELQVQKEPLTSNHQEDWLDIFTVLRCPYCLGEKLINTSNKQDIGNLLVFKNQWLICQNTDCLRKYPIIDNTPILFVEEGTLWINIEEALLPSPPIDKYPLIDGGEISVSADVSHKFRNEKYEDLGFEDFAPWAIGWYRKINKTIKRSIKIAISIIFLCGIIFILQNIIGR